MRRTIATITALLTAGLAFLAAPAAADAAPYCGLRWGSLPERAAATETAPLTGVRAGRHACFDRLVLDFAGDADGYVVRYVSTVRMDGSGQAVPLRGGADLEVVAVAPSYDAGGDATYTPADRRELVNVSGWRTFRQVAWAGSFEGQTTIGLGVRARLPFRVFTLDGPGAGSRLVVDVAHRW
ncbi:hypothetical protein [Jiangella sp. DSM 45060]|uniref:AMIN-like domain-containing (lipo)protein n=1 Tax=Jiangella sp. DSM 45060 TaxID=1798224 RepID=UPI00087BDE53|nr:hypothetical protein [Jiangella sp. DSM 45060]SDS05653.1 hypothetical protein SAMN04515669_0232 [Jiangella sp. DSM 45060]